MPNRLFRLFKVAWTLGRYDAILPKEFQNLLPPSAKILGSILRLGAKRDGDVGQRLSTALEKLGPVWIKLGQILATRPDIVGIAPAQALSGLKDKVAPFDTKIAKQIIADEFCQGDIAKLHDIFGDIGQVVAAASVAQVYKIKAQNGNDLALKIMRPNIAKQISKDIEALLLAAKIIDFLSPKSRRLNPIALVETVKKSLQKETDLRQEAGSCDAFGQICAIDNLIAIPKVDWNFSSKSTLATQWIDGKSLTNINSLDGKNRADLAMKINQSFLIAALEYGFFHADLHEGNLIMGDDGQLYAVDFGIMGRLGNNERRYLAEILYRFIKRDYRGAARVHFTAGYVSSDQDEGEFGIAMRAVCEPIWGKKASDVSMGKVLMQLFDVTEQFGMKLRPELVLLQKTMVQVEGVARNINPDHDIWECAAPVVERFMKRELGPEGALERTKEHIEQLATTLMKLPDLVEKLEKMVERK
jgi:ubiquinone biosynthesis protein